MKLPPLHYDAVHKFVEDLLAEHLHPKQVDSLAHAVLGAIHTESASIAEIGRSAACARDVNEKHSIKQVDRFIGNGKVAPFELMQEVIPILIAQRSHVVIALDWTEFASNDHATIAASMITEHGRATPLLWLTVSRKKLKSRRNRYEDRVLEGLRAAIPEDVQVTAQRARAAVGERELPAAKLSTMRRASARA